MLAVTVYGVDADGDGDIMTSEGEFGAEQAYQLSHQRFDIHLEQAE